jgi:hypothetical protein
MKEHEICESRSDRSGLPYICSLRAGHEGRHEAHTDTEGTIAATWPVVRVVWQVEDAAGVELVNCLDEGAAIDFARELGGSDPYGGGFAVMRGLLVGGRVV